MSNNYNEFDTFSNLHTSERIIVWSIREWVNLVKFSKDPRPSLISALSKSLVQEAVLPIDNFMRLIGNFSLNRLDIKCHCSSIIGTYEKEIIQALYFSQKKNQIQSKLITKNWVGQEHERNVQKNLNLIAESFSRASLYFPKRNDYIKVNTSNKKNQNDNIIYYEFQNK